MSTHCENNSHSPLLIFAVNNDPVHYIIIHDILDKFARLSNLTFSPQDMSSCLLNCEHISIYVLECATGGKMFQICINLSLGYRVLDIHSVLMYIDFIKL